MSLDRYHTIFFDVGGTLLRAGPSVGAVYVEVAERFGIHADARDVEARARRLFFDRKMEERRAGGEPHTISMDRARAYWREVVRGSFGPAADSPRFEAFFQSVFAEFARPERYRTFPEVPALLDELAARGARLGVLSNWDERLRPILDGMGLLGRFETVVISGEVKVEKPDRRIYEAARSMAGAPDDAPMLMIGDSPIDDLHGAREAGFDARLVRRGTPGETLRTILADLLDGSGGS